MTGYQNDVFTHLFFPCETKTLLKNNQNEG